MVQLSSINLYGQDGPPEFNLAEISAYLKKIYPKANLAEREDFFSFLIKQEPSLNTDQLAEKITLCRIHKVEQEIKEFNPLPLEIDYEKRRITKQRQLKGIIYDGLRMQVVLREYIRPSENNLSSMNIVFTNQLLATFDEADQRYHLRVGIYGAPNLISSSGLIEALAKPKQYYQKLQMGIDPLTLKQEFGRQIIDYDDSRISELLKGYCLQALFYHLSGDLFCQDIHCRLYNAHWQSQALMAQIESGYELCPKHRALACQWK